jgi:hypothetical protein
LKKIVKSAGGVFFAGGVGGTDEVAGESITFFLK